MLPFTSLTEEAELPICRANMAFRLNLPRRRACISYPDLGGLAVSL